MRRGRKEGRRRGRRKEEDEGRRRGGWRMKEGGCFCLGMDEGVQRIGWGSLC